MGKPPGYAKGRLDYTGPLTVATIGISHSRESVLGEHMPPWKETAVRMLQSLWELLHRSYHYEVVRHVHATIS